MKVFLLRHAEAEDTHPDEDRKLTGKGHTQLKNTAKQVPPSEFDEVVEVWHSTLVRARESAEIFHKLVPTLSDAKREEIEGLAPWDDVDAMAKLLGECEGDVVVAGHNPFLERLVVRLTAGEVGDGMVDFKKGGLIALERTVDPTGPIDAGLWTLNWFVVPRLGKKK